MKAYYEVKILFPYCFLLLIGLLFAHSVLVGCFYMAKTILIYANCSNATSKGDFVHAGNIAKDLANLLQDGDIKVVLTSTRDGIDRFKTIYDHSLKDHLMIEGFIVGLCSLEEFDGVDNEVIAFIEANHCKYAPAQVVKRVLSPDSKFLLIGAGNQPANLNNKSLQHMLFLHYMKAQPGLYDSFDEQDILIGASGVGPNRLGLPQLKEARELADLSPAQQKKIPKIPYGFMYFMFTHKFIDLITQYVKLTGLSRYVLIGDFTIYSFAIQQALINKLGFNKTQVPKIDFHQSLENPEMRKMLAGSHSDLVLSTGVMSAIEAMNENKLPYYQDFSENVEFVKSYLNAVKSICASDASIVNAPWIITLSEILFASKPLHGSQMTQVSDLMGQPSIKHQLIHVNKTIIKKANGTLAPQLLSFIGSPSRTRLHSQCVTVCQSLRKPGEVNMPVYDQALRRAASWGRLFELKVLVKSMTREEISKQDRTSNRFTALHWAVVEKQFDCARVLVNAGALIDVEDKFGKTPMKYAEDNGDDKMIALLDEADVTHKRPDRGCFSKAFSFIKSYF